MIIRTHRNDNGAVEVWDDADPDDPVVIQKSKQSANWDEASGSLTAAGLVMVASVLANRTNSPNNDRKDFSEMLDDLWRRWVRVARARIPNDSTDIDGRLGSDIHIAMRKIRNA